MTMRGFQTDPHALGNRRPLLGMHLAPGGGPGHDSGSRRGGASESGGAESILAALAAEAPGRGMWSLPPGRQEPRAAAKQAGTDRAT